MERHGVTEILFRHSCGETGVNHQESSWYPCHDSNLASAEYNSRALSLHQLTQLLRWTVANLTADTSLHDRAV